MIQRVHDVQSYTQNQSLYQEFEERASCGVGFIADIKGKARRSIVVDADQILRRMAHRGACGCEPNTGDGAGILTSIPHEFIQQQMQGQLPAIGEYAIGNIFLPRDISLRSKCKNTLVNELAKQDIKVLNFRVLPVDAKTADLGAGALAGEPYIEQIIVQPNSGVSEADFERKLYIARKIASHTLRQQKEIGRGFYICSLSARVVVYKGMLTPNQLFAYYLDLQNDQYKTHLAMVHSRFSTNTLPSWERAQPNRFMCHNGEINTLKGNVNAMIARQGLASNDLFKDQLTELYPIVEPGNSDSGSFDNVLELLLMAGRNLQEAVMMMVPEAWQNHESMSANKKAFYEYNASVMEPWDGPASVVFTNGHYIGAVLDRNGLRPSRYYVTHDDIVVMASEVGVLPTIAPNEIKEKGRLQPGRMFLIDFDQARLIEDRELKHDYASRYPYQQWLDEQRLTFNDLPQVSLNLELKGEDLLARMRCFGYTLETMHFMLLPLVEQERDPLGSMGIDTPLACLSERPRLIYDYFKQLFAQVTNPPIDSIWESIIMSLACYIGPEGNLLSVGPEHVRRLMLKHPILDNQQLAQIKTMNYRGLKTKTLDMTYDVKQGIAGLEQALDRLCKEALIAIDEHYSFIILSDRCISAENVPISPLLASGAVHTYLTQQQARTKIGIIVETGEAREVHHHCLLIGFGVDAINPYLAYEALVQARDLGQLDPQKYKSTQALVKGYKKGIAKGMLKVMAKMGISTLQSYKGAQIFEALGIGSTVMQKCFASCASRIGGVDFQMLAKDALARHQMGYPKEQKLKSKTLSNPGEMHWRAQGETHAWDPQAVHLLQVAARGDDKQYYQQFARYINEEINPKTTLRGLLTFTEKALSDPINIDQVESAQSIVKRFCTGAMSYGSISKETHESLALAMNQLGGKSNTGEGGEDAMRFIPLSDGTSKRSAIKQVASGRFGVTIRYLANADELQIKIAQGAKPGEGGELPGYKVDEVIASMRHSTPGVGLISPPPHHDIYSIEDLAQLIYDLKNANRFARISVKLVSEVGVGTIASGVAKAHADHILISGHDGGTGASPITSIKHAGLPWELGLCETHQALVYNNLRSRVVLQTDGQLKTGRDVAIAALLGAEEFGFATAPLIALGCIMMRKCHLNTCPVGIATQDKELRKKFSGLPSHVVNYLFMVAEELRTIMASLGVKTIRDMVGRVDLLEENQALLTEKTKMLDLKALLNKASSPYGDVAVVQTIEQNHALDKVLDLSLIDQAKPAIERGQAVTIECNVENINRVVGTMLSYEVTKAIEPNELKEDTIHIKLTGSAGQSLGAWLATGITIELTGDANDYVGKGLSGGRIVIYPDQGVSYRPEDNIIIGNVVLYGATKGECYFRGQAAERFAIRNSGANAVVEGVGDHGCEYMTGGCIVVLGPTGRNFAAGMSGGVAYVWDKDERFENRCNLGLVELESVVDKEDIEHLRKLIEKHLHYTQSTIAAAILQDFDKHLKQFVKVMPIDYKRVLQQKKQQYPNHEVLT